MHSVKKKRLTLLNVLEAIKFNSPYVDIFLIFCEAKW